jgi:DNA-binding CsgD family transcriptional regulator
LPGSQAKRRREGEILKEQVAGMKTAEISRKAGISQPTCYARKSNFGGVEA